MADLFDKIHNFTAVKEARAQGIYPYFLPLQNSEGATATFEGREVVMIGSNNYLGLTTHPKVRQAAMDAIAQYGTSCTGSRFLNGTLELHLELERRLARFMGAEAALTFTTGYQANVGTITALVGKGDYVICDKEDHASIIDGCQMSYGEMRRFSHNDVSSLDAVLARIPENAGKLVVVDGVYSMGGDIAPLPQIVAICKKHGARIMVDDAHSIGVLGNGRGTAAAGSGAASGSMLWRSSSAVGSAPWARHSAQYASSRLLMRARLALISTLARFSSSVKARPLVRACCTSPAAHKAGRIFSPV